MRVLLAVVMMALGSALPVRAEAPALTLALGGAPRTLSATELLERPDAATIEIPDDVAYGRSMTYRAVPLLALLGDLGGTPFDTIEATATDGFVAQLPLALVEKGADGGSVAWLAVEDPAKPWPPLPGKSASAGPFYLVWEHPQRSGVSSEQWPYQVAKLSLAESPGAPLAADGGRRRCARRCTGAARAGGVHDAVPAVPPHEGGGRGRCRTRSRTADEPHAVHDAKRTARAHPQPQGRAHLAGAADAGV